jgi:protein phosphatase 1L
MEDELEDRILYQTYLSHMKILSKLAVGFPFSSSHMWRILRLYVLKPEILLFSALLVVLVVYLHSVEVWSRNLLSKLHFSLGASVPSKIQRLQCFAPTDEGNVSWELKTDNVSVYAVQGRRQKMEDRFVVDENIDGCGVSLYAVFDGHGGEVCPRFYFT